MLERFWEICKTHPLWVGGGVLALVLLFIIVGKKGTAQTSQSAGIYDITQDPNVVAANAAESESQNQNNAAIAVAQIQAQAIDQQTAAQQALGLASINAQSTAYSDYFTAEADAAQAEYGAAVTINGQNTAAATQEAQISETGAVSLAGTAAASALALQSNQNQSNLALASVGLQSTQMGDMTALAKALIAGNDEDINKYYGTMDAALGAGVGGAFDVPGPYDAQGTYGKAGTGKGTGNNGLLGLLIGGLLRTPGASTVTNTQTGPNGTTTASTVVQTGKA